MSTDTPLHRVPRTSTEPPPALAAHFDGDRLQDKTTAAVGVLTADPDGWPHPAQLSAGEVLLSPDGAVRLALHHGSGTTENLRRDGRLVLTFAVDGANYELRFTVREAGSLHEPDLAAFTGRLVVSREHRAPYADVVAGVTVALHDEAAVLARWRRQVNALREVPLDAQDA